ncbi:MAG: cobalt-precorrin-5B (C(1))-methyltransferase [Cycloclasticus sp.]
MWKESSEQPKKLKSGLTTGSCATACCVAAAHFLFAERSLTTVSITLPKGKQVDMPIVALNMVGEACRAETIKDAGDDPDVTHGATVFVELLLSATPGLQFKAAKGVGTVTKAGLALEIGEPAINRVPRQMMRDNLQKLAEFYQYKGGFEVSVGVVNGEAIAQKTMNPRLGILGGLSILGTSGIVRPYSCSAWIASIYQGIDVAKASGLTHIAATTGNISEKAIQEHYQLEQSALIEMGDFAGAVLKHLKKAPIAKLSICGGLGKISKLANQHMDLHSRSSSIDFQHLADSAAALGANEALLTNILSANTSIEVLKLCQQEGIDIAKSLCEQALVFAESIVPASIEVEVWAIDRQGQFVAHAEQIRLNK